MDEHRPQLPPGAAALIEIRRLRRRAGADLRQGKGLRFIVADFGHTSSALSCGTATRLSAIVGDAGRRVKPPRPPPVLSGGNEVGFGERVAAAAGRWGHGQTHRPGARARRTKAVRRVLTGAKIAVAKIPAPTAHDAE